MQCMLRNVFLGMMHQGQAEGAGTLIIVLHELGLCGA